MNNYNLLSLFVGCLLVVLPLGVWQIIGIDIILSADLAKTIFSTLIQVNATLIGFFGIILVYHLREYSNNITMLRNQLLQTVEKRQLLDYEIEEEKNEDAASKLKRKKEVYIKNSNDLVDWYEETVKEKSKFGNKAIAPVAGFIISILTLVIALTKITVDGIETEWVMFALVPLFFGVVLLILSMGSSVSSGYKSSDSKSTSKT